jgi:hypothetical protein
MKKVLKQFCFWAILLPELTLCFSCQKEATPGPGFSAPGYWVGSFFSGATMAILNRTDGSGRVYLLTTGSVDTSAQIVKLDGTYNVQNNIFIANYIDTSGTIYINVQSSRTSSNSMEGVFFLNSSMPSGNTIETFDFDLVKH